MQATRVQSKYFTKSILEDIQKLSGCGHQGGHGYQGSVVFDIFINDTDSGINCTFSKFVDDTKLSCEGDTTEGQDAIQKDQEKLKKQAHENLTKFNRSKCKVLHPSQGNLRYKYRLGEIIESSPSEEDLGG